MTQSGTEHIGAVIRELRLERGVRQAELARAVGCHPKTVAKIEAGKRNPSAVLRRRIARVLDIPVGELREPNGVAA